MSNKERVTELESREVARSTADAPRTVGEATREVAARQPAQDTPGSSATNLSALVSSSPEAIITVDGSQHITLFNDGAEQMFGYLRAELLGKHLEVLIPERLRAAHRNHVAAFAADSEQARSAARRRFVIWGLHKNGHELMCDAAISKATVAGTTLLTVFMRDVSEEKRAERELRLLAETGEILLAAGNDYHSLLEHTCKRLVGDFADWCAVDIVEGPKLRRVKLVHADPAMAVQCEALEQLRVDKERVAGASQLLASGTSLLIAEVAEADIHNWAQDDEHLQMLRAFVTYSLIVVPLVARGNSVGLLALGSSRPSRRFDARDLRLVEQLSRSLALAVDNASLHQALQSALRAREEVLAVVAHDLRNPVNSILLELQLMQRRRGKEQELPGLDSIKRLAQRVNGLIQDLLDVARLQAGKRLSIIRQVVPPECFLDEARKNHQSTLPDKELTLDLDVAGALPSVLADRGRMVQVLDNLLDNAFKYGRSKVTVSAWHQQDEVVFRVTDDGPGITPDEQPHLFQSFWQKNSVDRRGAGLGLSIVKEVVDAHGGRLWVESEPGVGSSFYFTLPVEELARERSPTAPTPLQTGKPAP